MTRAKNGRTEEGLSGRMQCYAASISLTIAREMTCDGWSSREMKFLFSRAMSQRVVALRLRSRVLLVEAGVCRASIVK